MTKKALNQAMLRAAHENDMATVRAHLDQGADLSARDANGYTAAHWLAADANQNVAAIVELAKINMDVLFERNDNGDTVALLLAFSGNSEGVETVAKLAPEVLNQRDHSGNTPLMLLADWGDCPENVVRIARMNLRTLTHKNKVGETVCSFLARDGKAQALITLAEFDPRVITQHSPAHSNRVMWNLMISYQTELIHFLVKKHPDVLNQLEVRSYIKKNKLTLRQKMFPTFK